MFAGLATFFLGPHLSVPRRDRSFDYRERAVTAPPDRPAQNLCRAALRRVVGVVTARPRSSVPMALLPLRPRLR
jgi:hypothetical protein